MKTNLFTLFFILSSLFLNAQTPIGGPDSFGYTYSNSNAPNGPTYQWYDISGVGNFISGLADDNYVGPYPISSFHYYGNDYNQIYIGSNGFVSFEQGNIASNGGSFTNIPNSIGTNNFIAPFLTDLTFAGAITNPAIAFIYDSGDTTCITFEKVPFWVNNSNQYDGLNTFQIILNRADSSITFNYKAQNGFPDPAYFANYLSIGIENSTGTDGLQYYRGINFPADSTSIKFHYPSAPVSFTDINLNWSDNTESGGIFLSQPYTYSPEVNIQNTGSQDVKSPFSIEYLITTPQQNLTFANGSIQVDSLLIGQSQTITLPTINLPALPGRYLFKTFLSNVINDTIQQNDTNHVLLKLVDTTTSSYNLGYSNQNPNLGNLSWNGGNAGVGIYIKPPTYPARVVASNFYIGNFGTQPTGFHAVIFDDNARGGGPGTILDSTYVAAMQIVQNNFKRVPLQTPIWINSGGIYLMWKMGNGTISLGRSNAFPASKRTFEVIGGAWSPYRSRESEDFLMNIEIAPLSVGLEDDFHFNELNAFPNPSNHEIHFDLNNTVDISEIRVHDLSGREVYPKIMKTKNGFKLLKSNLEAGSYLVRYKNNSTKVIFTD